VRRQLWLIAKFPQVTITIAQSYAIIEPVHKAVSGILRSFELENDVGSLERSNPLHFLLQPDAYLPSY
jgi:hypothetical protein